MEVGIEGQDKEFIDQIKEAIMKRKIIDRVVEKALARKEKGWEYPLDLIKWQKQIYVLKDKKH